MTYQVGNQVFCAPLRVGHVRRDGAVAVYTPDGVRMMLTADAVAKSAASLARAAHEADAFVPHSPAAVIDGRFACRRRSWRTVLMQLRSAPGVPMVLTSALVPLVWAVLGGMLIAAIAAVSGRDAALRLMPLVVIALGPVAPVAAWFAAVRLLRGGPRRKRLRVGFLPRVIDGTGR
jgi:hypothetical protein